LNVFIRLASHSGSHPIASGNPAGVEIGPHDFFKGRSRYHQARRFRIQLPIGLIAHHKTIVAIEDDEPLGNAVDRVAQRRLYLPELLFDLLSQGNIGFQAVTGGLKLVPLVSQRDLVRGAVADFANEIRGEAGEQKCCQAGDRGDHPCMLAR
jgi:hypothetical protein